MTPNFPGLEAKPRVRNKIARFRIAVLWHNLRKIKIFSITPTFTAKIHTIQSDKQATLGRSCTNNVDRP